MKNIVKVVVLCLILMTITTYSSAADELVGAIPEPTIDSNLAGMLSSVVGVIQIVGTFVTVVASVCLGIRYVTSSVDEKASIKKNLIPYAVGVVIFYGATGILQLLAEIASWV